MRKGVYKGTRIERMAGYNRKKAEERVKKIEEAKEQEELNKIKIKEAIKEGMKCCENCKHWSDHKEPNGTAKCKKHDRYLSNCCLCGDWEKKRGKIV